MSLPADMKSRRAALLDELVSQTAAVAAEHNLSDEAAAHIGHALADYLAEQWGGQVLSFPKDASYRLSQRETEILAAHRAGASLASLALQYRMTMRGLRRLLRRAEQRDPDLNQGTLPFGEPGDRDTE